MEYEESTESSVDLIKDSLMHHKAEKEAILIPFNWSGVDTFFSLSLTFLALFSRFWILWSPRYLVSDEFKFLGFIHNYHNNTFFIDNEPYLGKQIVSFLSDQMWYNSEYSGMSVGQVFSTTNYNSIRSISAFFAAATVPLVYFVTRSFNVPSIYALAAGTFCLFEHSLIASSRWIGDRGISQFFVAMSFLFSGISYHFDCDSTKSFILIIFQSIFAGFAFSTSFSTFSVVIFAIVWPYLRSRNAKRTLVICVIPLLILYISCFTHVIQFKEVNTYLPSSDEYTEKHIKEQNKLQFNPWQLVSAARLTFKLFKARISQFGHLQFGLVLRRLTFTEKWTVIWSEGNRRAACFTNRLTTIPSLFLSIVETAFAFRKKSFNIKAFLSMYFILSVAIYAVEPSTEGCMNSYVITLISSILFPLCMERLMRRSYSVMACIFMIFIATISFIDWATLVYAYFDPHPIIKTWFAQ